MISALYILRGKQWERAKRLISISLLCCKGFLTTRGSGSFCQVSAIGLANRFRLTTFRFRGPLSLGFRGKTRYRSASGAALMEKSVLASEPAWQAPVVQPARQTGKFTGTLRTSQEWKTRGTIAPLASALLLKVAERQRLGLPHLREHRGAGGSGDRLFPFPSPCVPFLGVLQ